MEKYQVQEGDNLVTVAQKFGIRILALIEANKIERGTYLTPGEYIQIPTDQKNLLDFYTVGERDTLESVAEVYRTTPDALRKINGLRGESYLYPGEKLLVPKKNTNVYFSEEGDSLRSVAEFFGTTEKELMNVNPHLYLMKDQMIVYRK